MSMLSAQCDDLCIKANIAELPLGVRLALRAAADTIWQLREDLQRANAENAKLREELEVVGTAAYLYGRDDLKADNAMLRRGTTTRHAKYKTKYGRKVPLCECCSYSIGDMRWHFCPNCGAEVVDE